VTEFFNSKFWIARWWEILQDYSYDDIVKIQITEQTQASASIEVSQNMKIGTCEDLNCKFIHGDSFCNHYTHEIFSELVGWDSHYFPFFDGNRL
jgi:hypothetical protein